MYVKLFLFFTLLAAQLLAVSGGERGDASETERAIQVAPTVRLNRSVPKVTPPKTALEFSANPTVHEISRARVFEEALVPIGGEPTAEENAALAAALLAYAKRNGPDDFASLTRFLEKHPESPWRAALLTGLGFEYYVTAYYSRALEAWNKALGLAGEAKELGESLILARAVEELALLYARLGRMTELEALLKSTGAQHAPGASERINIAREALSLMRYQPGISFRCGPLALQSIKRSLNPDGPVDKEILDSVSTHQGFSLSQVAELSKKVGLNYQMAFRLIPKNRRSRREEAHSEKSDIRHPKSEIDQSLLPSAATKSGLRGDFVVPSVLHWKVGHYAALVRQVGDRYLVEDPTFRTTVWATEQALEAETSGYFLIPPGHLPRGWRSVDATEGASVWGKGRPGGNDPDIYTASDFQAGCGADGIGMAVSSGHLMLANLQIRDTPLGYTPPVGPPVRFTFRYNSRDIYATEGIFGGYYWNGLHNTNVYNSVTNMPPPSDFISPFTKMTHDWNSYLIDSPQSPLADVKYIVGGGGARTFKGFNTNSQTFAPQQYDQTLLKRTGADRYEMVWPDGSRNIFSQPNGSGGARRRVYLTQIADPAGNALTFTYDQDLRIVAVTDAIGQVTTLTYGDGTNLASTLLTRVIDPFGRFASFDYDKRTIKIHRGTLVIFAGNTIEIKQITFDHEYYVITNITDMLNLSWQPEVSSIGGNIFRMTTPYGTTRFLAGQGGGPNGTTRFLETLYPDGSRARVEYNQSTNLVAPQDPVALLPIGMSLHNQVLDGRNTFYWSRTAAATSYGDYTKAKIYHWLHAEDGALASGILESTKEPLENRVWYNYAGQPAATVGPNNRPTHIGRVLENGETQLYRYGYNEFGQVTNSVDPLGRTFSFRYASNGIDLLEVRQTRAGNNELLVSATYNHQHLPLTVVDAAGQTNTLTYNARGQLLTETNPKGETTSYAYDASGYLTAVDGPLSGTNDVITATYDAFGRVRTATDVSGYTLTFSYDNLDRITRVTYPDDTFSEFTYDRLDLLGLRDRAGRETFFEHDEIGQITKQIDPLSRKTVFDWCRCGSIKNLTDPMGRTTSWFTDVQGRVTGKQYADGSRVTYVYEKASSRLHYVIDEKGQVREFTWNRDDTLRSIGYFNTAVSTPGVSFTYDPDYERVISMTDGTGTTLYSYNPITGIPTLGAGQVASVDGPLPDDTITYGYDELGRRVSTAINGVASTLTYDAAGRIIGETNALGAFAYAYDGSSDRLVSQTFPGGQSEERSYGGNLLDQTLQRITHRFGPKPISEFIYGRDIAANRMTTWSQQAGAESPFLHSFGYDAVNQLLSATITNGGSLVSTFGYTYDALGNRLTEQVNINLYAASHNALNQLSTTTAPGAARTNEWDAENRLVGVNAGNERTEFTYDGLNRVVTIRHLNNGIEASVRRFVWCDNDICEERDSSGVLTKRFFWQGVQISTLNSQPSTLDFFYTRDHLGSIRELADSNGNVRACYSYDPYGRRTKMVGDSDADFGFAGMFWSSEVNLWLTLFRAYDPELGRWLSRDPLKDAEVEEGPNLYVYSANDPINRIDPWGLAAGEIIEVLGEIVEATGGEMVEVLFRGEMVEADSVDYWLMRERRGYDLWRRGLIGRKEFLQMNQAGLNLRYQPLRPAASVPNLPPSRLPGIYAAPSSFVGYGITILTMTDCNVVEGIFALYRQGAGGMANKYADKQWKAIKKYLP